MKFWTLAILMLCVEAYFDEGAAQVKRLLDRDRKELSNEAKPKAEYDNEYDLPSGSRNGSENASSSQSNALSDGGFYLYFCSLPPSLFILPCLFSLYRALKLELKQNLRSRLVINQCMQEQLKTHFKC